MLEKIGTVIFLAALVVIPTLCLLIAGGVIK